MKHAFTLDENVWVCACTGENEDGETDDSSFRLLEHVALNKHKLVFSQELWEKCQSKLSALGNQGAPLSARTFGLLNQIARNPETFFFVTELDDPPYDEERVPLDDRYVVRLAVTTQSILVTTDNRLLPILRQVLIALIALRPERAIPLAQEV